MTSWPRYADLVSLQSRFHDDRCNTQTLRTEGVLQLKFVFADPEAVAAGFLCVRNAANRDPRICGRGVAYHGPYHCHYASELHYQQCTAVQHTGIRLLPSSFCIVRALTFPPRATAVNFAGLM